MLLSVGFAFYSFAQQRLHTSFFTTFLHFPTFSSFFLLWEISLCTLLALFFWVFFPCSIVHLMPICCVGAGLTTLWLMFVFERNEINHVERLENWVFIISHHLKQLKLVVCWFKNPNSLLYYRIWYLMFSNMYWGYCREFCLLLLLFR